MLQTAAYTLRLALRLRRLKPDRGPHQLAEVRGLRRSRRAGWPGCPSLWHLRDRVAEDYLPRPAVRLVRMLDPATGRRRGRELRGDPGNRQALASQPCPSGDCRLGRTAAAGAGDGEPPARHRLRDARTDLAMEGPGSVPTGLRRALRRGAGAGGDRRHSDVRRGGLPERAWAAGRRARPRGARRVSRLPRGHLAGAGLVSTCWFTPR